MTIITSIFLLNRRYDSTIIVGEPSKLTESDRFRRHQVDESISKAESKQIISKICLIPGFNILFTNNILSIY
jgi:hypothetical protein